MVDLTALHDRFRSFIYLRDVHTTEWFEDFDKLRSGAVTREQFHRVFDTIRFVISDAEFDALANMYAQPPDKVNYRQFLDRVQDVFSNTNLEREPTGAVTDAHKIVNRTLGIDEARDEAKYQRLFRKLSHQISVRGVHVREAYEDFDHHNTGHVTTTQFFRAMPFKDLTTEELDLLAKRYSDTTQRTVNYRRIILDLNAWNQQNRPTETFRSFLPHQLASLKMKSFQLPPSQLMENFSNHVREGRIRIKEFFKTHDPLNKGLIPRGKFEATLCLFRFVFTEDDLKYLSERYQEIVDCTEYVRYLDFCSDVETTGEGVEQRMRTVDSREEPAPDLESVLARVRDTIIRFRINSLPTLQDFDRLGRGYITKFQFHRALSTLKIHITTAELDLIASVYEHENGIDFYKFVEDVDATHQQKRRLYQPIGTNRESIEAVYGHTPTGDVFVTPDVADEMIFKSKRGLLAKVGEQNEITSLLLELRRWTYVNSVDFHDFLEPFDRLKSGEITGSQFRTGIGLSTYNLTDTEFEVIERHYSSSTKPNHIRWRQFADDVIQAIAPLELEKTPQEVVRPPKETFGAPVQAVIATSNQPRNVETILETVARFVQSRRISLMEQFKDKDRFNHKRVTPTGFAQVLQLIGVHLSKAEIDVLCGFYNDAAINFVDYTQFCTDVSARMGQIFGDRASTSLVMNPLSFYGKADSQYLVSRRSTGEMPEAWEPVRLKLQSFIFKRRIRIDEFFLGFDNLRLGRCTDQKFRSVIGQCDLPITAEEIEFVINLFRVPGTNDLFDYRTFCHQINKIFGRTELQKKPVATGKPRVLSLPDPSATMQPLNRGDEQRLVEIIARMRNMVETRRMNIREQFADYDRAPHKNFITMQQFKQCIARLGLSTDPKEYDILCKRYSCTDLDDMNYHAFCDDIEGRSPRNSVNK